MKIFVLFLFFMVCNADIFSIELQQPLNQIDMTNLTLWETRISKSGDLHHIITSFDLLAEKIQGNIIYQYNSSAFFDLVHHKKWSMVDAAKQTGVIPYAILQACWWQNPFNNGTNECKQDIYRAVNNEKFHTYDLIERKN